MIDGGVEHALILELFTPEWKAQMAKDKRSLHQVVTMASLIEAEAQVE